MNKNIVKTGSPAVPASGSKKPFCKVCYDTGKPESVYTSHWVRTLPGLHSSGGGKITCPTLLATECRYCLKAGHTVKFCPTIEQRNKFMEKKKAAESSNVERKNDSKVSANSSSRFALLCDDDDDDDDAEQNVVTSTSCSWASIAAKPKVEPDPEMLPFSTPKSLPPSVIRRQTSVVPSWTTNKTFTKSWADFSDSDSETDDELDWAVDRDLEGEPISYIHIGSA